jgi:glycosyltransferase involved in cell wall biosynthesis
MTTISVALATYNGQNFLRAQLDSIATQTRPPDELVITDDASIDATVREAEQFARTAPFQVHIHKNPARLGYRANFMRALSLCQGDLLALCDQDDVWAPTKLAVAEQAFADPDTLLFFHHAWLIDGEGASLGPAAIFDAPPYNPPLTRHSLINPFGFSMVFHRALLQFSDLWEGSKGTHESDSRMPHDQWLYFLAAIFGAIAYSDQPLTQYRQHGANVYGFASTGGLRRRWQRALYRLTNHGPEYALLGQAARARAAILRACQTRLAGTWLERAEAGERACLRLADRLAMRAALYGEAPIWHRAAILARLYRDGAYAFDGGFGLGRQALAKDAAGLLLRPVLIAPEPRRTPGEVQGQ